MKLNGLTWKKLNDVANMYRKIYYIIFILPLWTTKSFAQDRPKIIRSTGDDYFDENIDGSYRFGYKNADYGSHFHKVTASRNNIVSGRYGFRNPSSQRIVQTSYTAGDRGFRAQGPDIARVMDLSQYKIPFIPPVPSNSSNYQPSYNTYNDPNEDPSYKFNFKTATYSRDETSNSKGTVNGAYSYIDDVGKQHDLQYEAGSELGFQVKTAFPDSNQFLGLFYRGPNKPGTPPRGHTSIVQNKDGTYKFYSAGPDQNRAEIKDSAGRVRGSYTYIDNEGTEQRVQYIAGPNIGFKIIRKDSVPFYSSYYPYPYVNPEFFNPMADNSFSVNIPSTELLPPFYEGDDNLPSVFPTYSYGEKISKVENKSLPYPDNFVQSDSLRHQSQTFELDTTTTEKSVNDDFAIEQSPDKSPKTGCWISKICTTRYAYNSQTKNYNYLIDDYQLKNPDNSPDSYSEKLFTPKGFHDFRTGDKLPHAYSYQKPSKGFEEESFQNQRYTNKHAYSKENKSYFTLPPGVPIKAYVQSIDILPYGYRIPPPEETHRRHLLQELHRRKSKINSSQHHRSILS